MLSFSYLMRFALLPDLPVSLGFSELSLCLDGLGSSLEKEELESRERSGVVAGCLERVPVLFLRLGRMAA